jgi:DNA-binding MarR family transcriptional regulator
VDAVSTHLDQQLCFALYASSRAMTKAYAPLLEPIGVTYPQYLVLLALWEEDDLTVSGIGDRLYLDSGTLTPLLKRLETQGLVTRRRDPEDERSVVISLTTAGKRHRSKAEGIMTGIACAMGMPISELIALRASLQKLMKHVHSYNEKKEG